MKQNNINEQFEHFFNYMLDLTIGDDLTNLDNASCKFYLKDAADYAIRTLDDRLARMQCPKRTKRVAEFFDVSPSTVKRNRKK